MYCGKCTFAQSHLTAFLLWRLLLWYLMLLRAELGFGRSFTEFSGTKLTDFEVNSRLNLKLPAVGSVTPDVLTLPIKGRYSVQDGKKSVFLASHAAAKWSKAFGMAGLSAELQVALEITTNDDGTSSRTVVFCGKLEKGGAQYVPG